MIPLCKEARNWLISHLKNAHIADLLQHDGLIRARICKGGFKPIPANIEKNRRIIIQRLTALFEENSSPLLVISAKFSPFHKAYEILREAMGNEGLRRHWRLLMTQLKDARGFVLAITLENDDTSLIWLGGRLLNCPSLWRQEETWRERKRPGDAAGLAALLAPVKDNPVIQAALLHPDFPRPIQGLLPLTQTADKADRTDKTPKAQTADKPADKNKGAVAAEERPTATDRSLKQQAEMNLKAALKEAALRKECDSLRGQLKEAVAQGKEKDARLRELQGRMEEVGSAFEGALAEMRDQKERDLRDANAALEARLLGVHPDLHLFATQNAQAPLKLKERVEAALAKQRAVNGKTVLRQELLRRLNRLEELRRRVNDAIEDAISPIPELAELEREITSGIDDCQQKLNEHLSTAGVSMPCRLRDHIKAMPYDTPDALQAFHELREALGTPLWRSLLAPDELDAARRLITERERLCPIAQAAADLIQKEDGRESAFSQLPHYLTLTALKERLGNVALVVDGCNAMLRSTYWHDEIEFLGEKEARKEFVTRIGRVLGGRLGEITLIFDGQGVTDTVETYGKVRVIYAAHTEESQNADNCIVKYLGTLQPPEDEAAAEGEAQAQTQDDGPEIIVCTDDGGLEARIAGLCDGILETTALAAVVS